MKNIHISYSNNGDMIKQLAHQWEVEVEEDYEKTTVKVPQHLGTGTVSSHALTDNMGIVLFNCNWKEDVELKISKIEVEPFMFNYCLDGKAVFYFNGDQESVHLHQYKSLIQVSDTGTDFRIEMKRGYLKMRSITVDRKLLKDKFQLNKNNNHKHLSELFDPSKIDDTYYFDDKYSVVLSHYFERMDEILNGAGLVRKLKVEGITLQILSEQLNLYKENFVENNKQRTIRLFEQKYIQKAASILEDELSKSITTRELADRINVNRDKLQEGFKLLYGSTINSYVQKLRLERIAFLLQYSKMPISKIPKEIGLKSKSYVSKIFKEAYGVTPSQYRKNKTFGQDN